MGCVMIMNVLLAVLWSLYLIFMLKWQCFDDLKSVENQVFENGFKQVQDDIFMKFLL